ncbi:MAG: GNAT family N-acetyltransferase [Planctomycetales bacterium]|nr:GNAT family N-acetyltransferase [Planctomycetales bacterium]
MAECEIVHADLDNLQHQAAVVALLDAYASDPMGDAKPLSDFARANLIRGLQTHPTTMIFLAFQGDMPRGIAICFRGFSTFAAKPLINISDFYVNPSLRGRGLGRSLLAAIQEEALSTGCCKLTLEVQQNNARARAIYEKFGFAQAVYAADENCGGSLCMTKAIS